MGRNCSVYHVGAVWVRGRAEFVVGERKDRHGVGVNLMRDSKGAMGKAVLSYGAWDRSELEVIMG